MDFFFDLDFTSFLVNVVLLRGSPFYDHHFSFVAFLGRDYVIPPACEFWRVNAAFEQYYSFVPCSMTCFFPPPPPSNGSTMPCSGVVFERCLVLRFFDRIIPLSCKDPQLLPFFFSSPFYSPDGKYVYSKWHPSPPPHPFLLPLAAVRMLKVRLLIVLRFFFFPPV